MMLTYKKILNKILIFCLLFFLSCEKELETDSGNFKPQLVLNSILDTDTTFSVMITHTSAMTDTSNTLINDATVELWANNIFLENLVYDDKGIYKSAINKPIPGNAYKIIAKAANYADAVASDTIPLPVIIEDSYYIFHYSHDINHPSNADINLSFQDPAETRNFYEIVIYTKSDYAEHGSTDTTTHIDYYNEFTTDDPIVKYEGDMDYNPTTIYFSDDLFNGKHIMMSVNIITFGGGFYNGIWDFSGQFKIAELRSVSYSYYQYRKKWTHHLYNQGISLNVRDSEELRDFLFTGEPVNMYTNIENGYGIFAGYSKSKFTLRKVE